MSFVDKTAAAQSSNNWNNVHSEKVINERLARIQECFFDDQAVDMRDLRRVITRGASDKKPFEITTEEAEKGLWEERWSLNLVDYLKSDVPIAQREEMLDKYLQAIRRLDGLQHTVFGVVDKDMHERLVDKLQREVFLHPDLPVALQTKIVEFNFAAAKIGERRVSKLQSTDDFMGIFGDPQYWKIRDIILGHQGVLTAKHCTRLYNPAHPNRLESIQRFFIGLRDAAMRGTPEQRALADKMVGCFEKYLGKYNKNYTEPLPEAVQQAVVYGLQAYNLARLDTSKYDGYLHIDINRYFPDFDLRMALTQGKFYGKVDSEKELSTPKVEEGAFAANLFLQPSEALNSLLSRYMDGLDRMRVDSLVQPLPKSGSHAWLRFVWKLRMSFEKAGNREKITDPGVLAKAVQFLTTHKNAIDAHEARKLGYTEEVRALFVAISDDDFKEMCRKPHATQNYATNHVLIDNVVDMPEDAKFKKYALVLFEALTAERNKDSKVAKTLAQKFLAALENGAFPSRMKRVMELGLSDQLQKLKTFSK